jgi:putative ABC transport system permease protein
MSLADGLRIAFVALTGNKLRTALTMLGIIIGVGAVITLIAVGRGAQDEVTARISGLGSNLLFVTPGAQSQAGVRSASGTAATLSLQDTEAIAENTTVVSGVAPEANSNAQLLYQGQNLNTRVLGTTAAYQDVRNFHAASGDFISDQDVQSSSNVAVLGASVAQTLFGGADPIGQVIRISSGRTGLPFRVVGVMESKGGTSLGNQDNQVIIPITTLTSRLQVQRTAQGASRVSQIDVQVTDKGQLDTAVQQIGDLLRTQHRVTTDDFTIQSQQDTLQALTDSTNTFTVLLGSIAGISLLVGGIGIMNILLVSVTERTREIGLRKAMGARRQDILVQFLIEAVAVSFIGGGLGIAAGVGLAHLADGHNLLNQVMYTSVRLDSVLLAFVVSAAIGVFFGLYPAVRAARLNPIEALRYE